MDDRNPYLTDGGTLRNAERAVTDPRKFVDYVLNPEHQDGRHKTFLFARLLGYDRSNAEELIQRIRDVVLLTPAQPRAIDKVGACFAVDPVVTGAPGRSTVVRTGWIYRPGETAPFLTMAFIRGSRSNGQTATA